MRTIEKLGQLFRELGPTSAVLYLLGRIFQLLSCRDVIHRYILVAQPVPKEPLLPKRRGLSIEVRPVDQNDPALAAMPTSDEVLAYRFGQGALCFGAFQQHEMIGCLWLKIGHYDEDEVRCRFAPMPEGGASWDFDVYILPERRSGLAFARLWDTANSYLRDRGIAWSFSRISAFNAGSLASHSRLGAKRIGTATFLAIGRLQLMVSTLRPFVHLSFDPRAFPLIPLCAAKHRDFAGGPPG